MIKLMKAFLKKAALRAEIHAKQKLYAKILKEHGQVSCLKTLSKEIGELNLKLCSK